MNNHMPRTPLSTQLSRSARETEIRIRNIFSGPKKRPPIPLMILIAAVCIFCGNIVSCQMAEAEAPDTSRSEEVTSAGADAGSASVQQADGWRPVPLTAVVTVDCPPDNPLPREEIDRLEGLPADELPREAVEVFHAVRQDYWRDMLLPVAYDQGTDLTVYFVVDPDSMPNVEPLVSPLLWGELDRWGVLLRLGNHLRYFDLNWEVNAAFCINPLLNVDDLDGDGQPEAALSLTWGEGTGCYCESLFIIKLDPNAMYCSYPHFSNLPLEITCNPAKTTARITSGDKEFLADLTRLGGPFEGEAYAGNQVRFLVKDGQLICHLDFDFSGMDLGYLAGGDFPIVYEDGAYKLGPAVWMGDIL